MTLTTDYAGTQTGIVSAREADVDGDFALQPRRGWVSKTDVMRYFRCPYAFSLLERGEITFDDTIDEFTAGLIATGQEFHAHVEALAPTLEQGWTDTLEAGVGVLGVPIIDNPALRLVGRPDGIRPNDGAYEPIEIKSHTAVSRTDELELAFYWLLLEPLRTRANATPRGHVILRQDGLPVEQAVEITPKRIAEVRKLIRAVRSARRNGVKPRICGCRICSEVRKEDVRRSTTLRRDVTMIQDISWRRAEILEDIGITTWQRLRTADPEAIKFAFRVERKYVSTPQIERWQRHADAYAARAPVLFGEPLQLEGSFIAIDLEYDAHIWLAGACVVDAGGEQYHFWWADDVEAERRNLLELAEVLRSRPHLPVITWNGHSADLPQLRHAERRMRRRRLFETAYDRHVDVYKWMTMAMRLPIPGLGLKDVGDYFGVKRRSRVLDGLDAKLRWFEYGRERNDHRRDVIRRELTEYNRDDLEALVATTRRLVAFCGAARTSGSD